jgi:hypothetical protein
MDYKKEYDVIVDKGRVREGGGMAEACFASPA